MKKQWTIIGAALMAAGTLSHAATKTVDDNTPGYTSNPAWTTVTTGQVVGADQQTHPGMSAATIVDNSSPSFSETGGVWTTGSTLPFMIGANYAVAPYWSNPAKVRIATVVIDDATYAADYGNTYGCSQGGTAGVSNAGSGYFGSGYQVLTPRLGVTSCRYTTILQYPGNFGGTASVTLSAHWPSIAGLASNGKVTVKDPSGTVIATYFVNQQVASGEWAPLGTFNATAGSTLYVYFDATGANGNVIADAIKLEPSDVGSEVGAKWLLPNRAGKFDIYAHTPAASTSEASPAMMIVGSAGSQRAFNYNPRGAMGQWQYIGTADLGGTQSNYVLMQQWYPTGDMLADAIAYAPAGTFPIAKWTDTSSSPRASGQVTVTATWGAAATRTHRAVYAVSYLQKSGMYSCTYANNVVTVVDQTLAGTGTSLGTFTIDPMCPGVNVTLTPDGDSGTLSADAIQITTP